MALKMGFALNSTQTKINSATPFSTNQWQIITEQWQTITDTWN